MQDDILFIKKCFECPLPLIMCNWYKQRSCVCSRTYICIHLHVYIFFRGLSFLFIDSTTQILEQL